MIDDDAHGALARVRADIDHRAGEALVVHRRHRDQHLAVEIATRRLLASRFARKLHDKRLSNQSAFANDAHARKFNPPTVIIKRSIVAKSPPAYTLISRCSQ